MRHVRGPGIVLLLLLGAALGGCRTADYATPERFERGLVVILDGAGDITTAPQQIMRGLEDGGVRQAMVTFAWSADHNALADQQDLERNRQVAASLTERLLDYMNRHPDRPVHLIGLSAGTGIVVFALEQLPRERPVDGVCLLSSSLSANYNLAPALTRVRYKIMNFSSHTDPILGLAVPLTGTVDRGSGPAAGLGGFTVPKNDPAAEKLYKDKLTEIPYDVTYIVYGDLGTHLGPTSSAFVQHFMAPIILDDQRRRESDRAKKASGSAPGAVEKQPAPRLGAGGDRHGDDAAAGHAE